ncbi:MAG: ATP synthase F1 subunit delta [Lewinella sp.]|nr:ATP synthase F1 subunit delta [Lewinella sp.]
MSVQRITSRYAKSLIDLAIDQNKLDRVFEDVKSFQAATKVRDFYMLLKSPVVSTGKKNEIIDKIFSGKLDELTMAFLRILVNKGREPYLPEIASELIHQYKKLKHISTVKLTTAAPVGAETVKAIQAELEKSSVTDQFVEVVTAVDPELIGGFTLELEDKIYDASVASKLEKLRKDFTSRNLFISQVSKK